jgi:hypothetical protein
MGGTPPATPGPRGCCGSGCCGSIIFVEYVFSLSNAQWTMERNSLQADTVKAVLQVIVNYDFTCTEMHKFIHDNKKLLNDITGGEKY